ncbi:hypothetical protein VTN00DRAFT_1616 [Thermoascus crustaceus]|uniref:uncharacterized protein n=1 Tax=Thermoascus crustaceus TaxID=5088 RepID=UPI003744A391
MFFSCSNFLVLMAEAFVFTTAGGDLAAQMVAFFKRDPLYIHTETPGPWWQHQMTLLCMSNDLADRTLLCSLGNPAHVEKPHHLYDAAEKDSKEAKKLMSTFNNRVHFGSGVGKKKRRPVGPYRYGP